MAISVNEVYQTILAVANKEQRGYITPQEFNLFANKASSKVSKVALIKSESVP